MSATLKNIYGAVPTTTRGKPILVGPDPKGKNWVYTCGNAVFIRSLEDPLKCEMYTEHQYQTTVARYAPSGFYIASGDITGTIRIWDTTQETHILKIELKMLSGPILDLAWSEDSKRIVVVGDGKEKYGAVFLWDSGSSVGEISGHSKTLASCDMKQTRPYRIATGGEDMLVNYFEGPPFKFKKSIKDHTRFVNCVRFSPNGEKFLSVGSDKNGFFFDGKTGDPAGKLSETNGHTAGIYACSWSPDSKRVVTASADKTCKIWNADNGECLVTFKAGEALEDQQLGCLWQGSEIISISLGGDVTYWDEANPSAPKRVVKGHNKAITTIGYDATSQTLFSASYDAAILAWDINTGATKAFAGKGHTNQIAKLRVQADHIVTAAMDDTVRVTSTVNKQYSAEATKLDSPPCDLAVGNKDTALAVATTVDSVVVIRGGAVVNKHVLKYQPASVAISMDDRTVAVGGKDNDIHLYTLSGNNLSEGPVLKGHRGAVGALQFSPDGSFLGSADWNREVIVWDLLTNQPKIKDLWTYHSARINALSWSRNSQYILTGGLDGNFFIWSIQNPNNKINVRNAHAGGVNAAIWIDDITVATAGQDCTVKSWSVKFH